MMVTREQLEQNEMVSLASYAQQSRASRGRLYPDNEPAFRTRFQRDRERILHTSAFRRLQYKTQVFLNLEGDYYRTRLTHTLEVAQLGRSIARALQVNEDLTEAICLAHDLGHPPFGHSGEHVLNQLMAAHGGFEHNRQSFRVVTELETRYPDFPGLNLSWEVLEGIAKHESEYDHVQTQLFDPHLRGHLEAQIANIVDELAYTTSDLDDGLYSGVLNLELMTPLGLWQRVKHSVGWDGVRLDELDRHRLIRRLVGLQVKDVVEHTSRQLLALKPTRPADIQVLPHDIVGWSPEFQELNRELKRVLYNSMYRHYRVVRMSQRAEKFLTDLFEAYLAEPAQLPPEAQTIITKRGRERAVCDYLASMTDRAALDEHARLFNPHTRP